MKIKLVKMNKGECSQRPFYRRGCECCYYYPEKYTLTIDNQKKGVLEQIHYSFLANRDFYLSYDRCFKVDDKINQRKIGDSLVMDRYAAKKFVCDQKWKDPNVPIIFIPTKKTLEKILENVPESADAFCIKKSKFGAYEVEFYNIKDLTRWGMAV